MTYDAHTLFDIAIAAGGIAYIVAQVMKGRRDKKTGEDNDAIQTIRIKDMTIDTLKEQYKELNTSFIEQGKEIAVLKSDNQRLQAIFENRNPEMESFIKTADEALKSIMTTNGVILQSIQTLLKEMKNNK